MSYLPDTIIDYFGNAELCLGIVTKAQTDRVFVRTATESNVRVAFKQVLCEHGACPAGANALSVLSDLQNRIGEARNGIDVEFLWNILLENPELTSLTAIAREYFGQFDAVQLSAMARALSEDTLHFQRNGIAFTARTTEETEELLALRRQRAERAARKERMRLWLLKVIAASPDACKAQPFEVPEEMEPFVGQIADYLLNGFNSDAVNLLGAAPSKLRPRELALSVLKKTGRLPKDADEFLLANGIHAGFSRQVLDFTAQVAPFDPAKTPREECPAEELFSIDDQWTREIDDALSVTVRPDGSCEVGVHLANPSCFVGKNDLLDQVAVDRPLSLYLPTTTVTMFPEAVGCDLASLNQDALRPAMSLLATFGADGGLLDWRFALTQIRVTRRLTYVEADAILEDTADNSPLAAALRTLKRLAELLGKGRADAGAISLNRPEMKIVVRDGEVQLFEEDQGTAAHKLVAEFMVLANHLAARYALHNDVPIIYRCQDPASEDVHSVIDYDPVDFDLQVRKMRRTRLSTYPQPHFGLGLDLYTQISSPLRRYADMVIQRQMAAHMGGLPLPYTQQELMAILDNVESTASTNRALEREARKFWLLEYLLRNCVGKVTPATVVRVEGNLILAELDEYYERGVLFTRDRPAVGDRLDVRITAVNPAAGRLTLEPA